MSTASTSKQIPCNQWRLRGHNGSPAGTWEEMKTHGTIPTGEITLPIDRHHLYPTDFYFLLIKDLYLREWSLPE